MSPESPAVMGLLTGAQVAGFLVVALFYLRFWRRTRDSLFLAFACAFAVLALVQPLPMLLGLPDEGVSRLYLIRLAAFSLIIVAILFKNLKSRK